MELVGNVVCDGDLHRVQSVILVIGVLGVTERVIVKESESQNKRHLKLYGLYSN